MSIATVEKELTPQPLIATREYTPDDLLMIPDGDSYELVDGQLVEKDMGAESDFLGLRLGFLLAGYVDPRLLGRVLGPQTGYQCFPDAPKKVRKPDLSFIKRGRLPGERIPRGHILIAPDVAVE